MFSQSEFAKASFVQMRKKDALCIGINLPHEYYEGIFLRPNLLTDYFVINGEKYQCVFPKVGDIVVGISADKYTVTDHKSICEVTGTMYSRVRYPDDDDIKVHVLNKGYCPIEYWVNSLFFRYATEEERRSVGR